MRKTLSSVMFLVGVVVTSVSLGQGAPATPGPEHKEFEKYVGAWDCDIKMGEESSKGSATYKIELGGLWLTSNFDGDFGGMKFQGRGHDTYDAAKKKFVSVWIDSMSTQPLHMEGSLDKDGKTLKMVGDAPGPDGKPIKMTGVTKWTDAKSFVFTMSGPGEDGKDMVYMTITYTKKK